MEPGTVRFVIQKAAGLAGYPLVRLTATAGGITFARWLDAQYLEVGLFEGSQIFLDFTTATANLTAGEVWLPGDESTGYGPSSRISHHPDGVHLAYVADGSIYIADRRGETRRLLATGACEICSQPCYWSLAFSPDGRDLAFDDCQALHIVDQDTGEERYTYEGLTGSLSWSPDGRFLAFCTGFVVVDEGEGVAQMTPIVVNVSKSLGTELPPLPCYFSDFGCDVSLQWLNEGRQLLFTGKGAWRIDLSAWTVETLPHGDEAFLSFASPAGEYVAYTTFEMAHLHSLLSGRTVTLSMPFDGVYWSPTGAQVLLQGYRFEKGEDGQSHRTDHNLIANIETDESLEIALPGFAPWTRAISWSPDGQRLAYATEDGALWVFDLAAGRPAQVAPAGGGCGYCDRTPRWSPDGRQIAFAWKEGELYLVDVSNLYE